VQDNKQQPLRVQERGPRLNKPEPTLPQPFRRLVLVCKVQDKLWGKLVLVALRLPNSLQDKQAT
jgi:hypothetical protein